MSISLADRARRPAIRIRCFIGVAVTAFFVQAIAFYEFAVKPSSGRWQQQDAFDFDVPLLIDGSTEVSQAVTEVLQAREHPHAGAKDENGNWGYVHDPTVLVHSPIPFSIPSKEFDKICASPGEGDERQGGYKLLTEKVRVANATHSGVKIFCAIYTYEENDDRIIAIAETWGRRCDGFMAASTFTNHSTGTVHIPHIGEENYDGIWQKVRSMWAYMHDNFLEKYDFFHICGDDTYVIVDNLRAFVEGERVINDGGGKGYPLPLYMGQWIMKDKNQSYFLGGGSGYTLNRAALRLLVREAFPMCHPFTNSSQEDVLIAECMQQVAVFGYDARDTAGEQRYLGSSPNFIYNFLPDLENDGYIGWWTKVTMGMPPKFELEAASSESVAFHHIQPGSMMRRVHKLLYHQNMSDCMGNGR